MRRLHPFSFSLAVVFLLFASGAAHAKGEGFRATFFQINPDRWYTSHGWSNGAHQSCEWRKEALSIRDNKVVMTFSDEGGEKRPYGCPEFRTKEKLGYGLYETRMKTAAGSGLCTGFFTYVGPPTGSKEHDEIDFEFLGKNPRTVDLNYFVNGKSMLAKRVDLGFDASKDFHDYAFDWSPEGIKWFVDGKKIYETPAGSPLPKNPGQLFYSLWSGASPMQDAWMGPLQYKEPVEAEVAWVRFTPHKIPTASKSGGAR